MLLYSMRMYKVLQDQGSWAQALPSATLPFRPHNLHSRKHSLNSRLEFAFIWSRTNHDKHIMNHIWKNSEPPIAWNWLSSPSFLPFFGRKSTGYIWRNCFFEPATVLQSFGMLGCMKRKHQLPIAAMHHESNSKPSHSINPCILNCDWLRAAVTLCTWATVCRGTSNGFAFCLVKQCETLPDPFQASKNPTSLKLKQRPDINI